MVPNPALRGPIATRCECAILASAKFLALGKLHQGRKVVAPRRKGRNTSVVDHGAYAVIRCRAGGQARFLAVDLERETILRDAGGRIRAFASPPAFGSELLAALGPIEV